jgi:hypothetical protein
MPGPSLFVLTFARSLSLSAARRLHPMSNRFLPLRPPVKADRRTTDRAASGLGFTIADVCLTASLLLSLALALI